MPGAGGLRLRGRSLASRGMPFDGFLGDRFDTSCELCWGLFGASLWFLGASQGSEVS